MPRDRPNEAPKKRRPAYIFVPEEGPEFLIALEGLHQSWPPIVVMWPNTDGNLAHPDRFLPKRWLLS